MPPITLMERLPSTFVTAFSIAAALALLGLDVLWLMGEALPLTGRQLVEWQIAPVMACGLVALAAWTARRDRRRDGE